MSRSLWRARPVARGSPGGKSTDTLCPHCVYIGVPPKKTLQFFVERLQGNIIVDTYVKVFFGGNIKR